jgi:hypothetical protein
MPKHGQHRIWIGGISLRAAAAGLALVVPFGVTIVATQAAQAQPTYRVLHNFTGGADGANPSAGLTFDRAGNLYGTTFDGGSGYGGVFKLKHSGSAWLFSPLYSFAGGNDGAGPNLAPLAPFSSKCVAKQCRSVCGWTFLPPPWVGISLSAPKKG